MDMDDEDGSSETDSEEGDCVGEEEPLLGGYDDDDEEQDEGEEKAKAGKTRTTSPTLHPAPLVGSSTPCRDTDRGPAPHHSSLAPTRLLRVQV